MRALLFLTIFVLMLTGVVGAQMGPTIVQFETDLETVSLAALEREPVSTTLRWYVANMSGEYSLTLEWYRFDEWVSVIDPGQEVLASGFRNVTVMHPLNFGAPTYRLRVLDGDDDIVDERTLVIRYAEEPDVTPTVGAFESDVVSVGRDELADRSARVPVSWEILNRQPLSHLRFEQVFPDGSTRSVELPRDNMWVASTGSGMVAPRPAEGSVQLRLSVVNIIDGEVYDQRDIDLPISDRTTDGNTFTGPPETFTTADACSEDPTNAEIMAAYAYLQENPPDVPITIWGTREYLETAYDELLAEGLIESPPPACTLTARQTVDIYTTPGGDQTNGYIPVGRAVPILGRSDDSRWFYVELSAFAGWVSAADVDVQEGTVIEDIPVRDS